MKLKVSHSRNSRGTGGDHQQLDSTFNNYDFLIFEIYFWLINVDDRANYLLTFYGI